MLTEAERDRVSEYLERAWDAEKTPDRTMWARKVIEIDPDELDGYLLLSKGEIALAERIALLSEAVRRGKVFWADEIKRPAQSHFWLDVGTRPFMRCLHVLSLTQWSANDRERAVANAKLLLRINPNDNQGIRYLLMAWYPVVGDWDSFTKLLTKCKDEGRTEYLYSACLNAFRLGKETDAPLAEAFETNPFVPQFLADKKRLPQDDGGSLAGYPAFGPESEAQAYADFNHAAWLCVEGALAWLTSTEKAKT